jgi:hypothetical protein
LTLHDVDDAEAFVGAIVSRCGFALSHHEREDLSAYLVASAWELSLRYDRGDPQYSPRFALYAKGILGRRAVDWNRKRLGRTVWKFKDRTYERPRRELVDIDAPHIRELVDAVATWGSDSETDCDSPVRRLFDERDRYATRDYAALGLEPDRRVAN